MTEKDVTKQKILISFDMQIDCIRYIPLVSVCLDILLFQKALKAID